MRIHIVGVAGTGMGALANLLCQLGHEVSGSDVRFDPPIGPALKKWGVTCYEGFDPSHLDMVPDRVVVGNVCRRDNAEAEAAFERGMKVTHLPGALREFALESCSPLVVTGTHGKTTTSALCAYLLDRCGLGPGFLIGGLPLDFADSARPIRHRSDLTPGPALGRRPPFVLEGDEYDTSFFEKTAKFLHYGAEIAILTSLEHDHIDIYPTFEDYRQAFERMVTQIPSTGLLVAHAGSSEVIEIATKHAACPVITYGIAGEQAHVAEPDFLATVLESAPYNMSFRLEVKGVHEGNLVTRLVGRHNVRNILGALAAAHVGFGVSLARLAEVLPDFKGVARRQQHLESPRGIHVIDDFAHHPTAVYETLAALRHGYPGGRLIAVFEPRSATACRKLHQRAYVDAFAPADLVLVAPLGRTQLPANEQLDTDQLARDLRARGQPAEALDGVPSILDRLSSVAEAGDCIALLSNGAFGGIHRSLLARLQYGG